MRYLFILLATSLLAPTSSVAQNERYALGLGVVYGYETGFGWSTGGTKLNGPLGSLSHASARIAFKDDGIDQWGPRYKAVGRREFPEHIVDTGYSSTTLGGAAGVRAWKHAHVLASLEYQMVYLVQKRYDDTAVFRGNRRYFTRYRVSERSGWGIGGGVKFFIPVSGGLMITPALMGTTTSKIILSLGVAVGDPW